MVIKFCPTGKKPLFGGRVFTRLTEYKRPNGGFEITIKSAVIFFKSENTEGVLKSFFFKNMEASNAYRIRRYRYVLFLYT